MERYNKKCRKWPLLGSTVQHNTHMLKGVALVAFCWWIGAAFIRANLGGQSMLEVLQDREFVSLEARDTAHQKKKIKITHTHMNGARERQPGFPQGRAESYTMFSWYNMMKVNWNTLCWTVTEGRFSVNSDLF